MKQQNIPCAAAQKGEAMNVKKPADYSAMYRELTEILARNLPQMNEIHAIGKAVSQRPEKGAAVAAAEFLQTNLPDRTGFSPRNVRRMRDFYKVYENDEPLLRLAMKIGWTLNVVIMEAELTREARRWYLEQAKIRNWTKAELQLAIIAEAHKAAFAEATAAIVSNQMHCKKFVQQPVAQIPWGHNVVLLDKISGSAERLWYAERSKENGWSRNVLVHQIESGLYQRQALAEKVSNFELRLPSPQSELAIQTMKDPYIFDFIPFRTDMLEREIEEALVKDVTKLLLELGTGFAFLGNQYHLNVGGDDFYIDLLFYNLNLRCYVVIELKTGEFKPEYAGQLNFYLSAVDGILKKEQDPRSQSALPKLTTWVCL